MNMTIGGLSIGAAHLQILTVFKKRLQNLFSEIHQKYKFKQFIKTFLLQQQFLSYLIFLTNHSYL